MRFWALQLPVDRAIYQIDLRRHRYEFVRANPDWATLDPAVNARNKRQLHGLTRVRRDGTTTTYIDRTWPYTKESPCPECGSWIPRDSPCDHEYYQCPTCGRRQCLRHWPYPMRTEREAQHFLAAARARTGKQCFVRPVERQSASRVTTQWKIFTSEGDYASYLATGRHRR